MKRDIRIPVTDMTKHMRMTLKVTGVRMWKFRMTLGLALLRFAVWVMGVETQVEVDEQ